MLILEGAYGEARSFRLGRLRAQATGLFIAAPTIAAGDFKITQDDGVGEDNVDNIPTVDTGTGDLLWTVSAAEMTAPSANGPYRIMHAADAAGAEWLDRDFLIVTTDHQSAAKVNGVVRQVVPAATPGVTSFTVSDGTQPTTALGANFINCVALVVASDIATDVNCCALITAYSFSTPTGTYTYAGGWNRTPTGTAAQIKINLYAAAIGKAEAVGSVPLANINTEADTALTDYDAPTNAEMEARTIVAANYATAAELTIVNDFLDSEIAAILALLDDARTEPGQGAPPVNPDVVTKIDYLYKAWRNRHTQTATEYALYADNTTTKDQEATVTDDGVTLDRGEVGTGA